MQTLRPRSTSRLTGTSVATLGLVVALLALLASCTTAPESAAPAVEQPVDPGWEMRTVDTLIAVDLPEPFVKLVDLARLHVGMTKAEVLAIFPDPEEIQLKQGDEFWQYGFAELIFRNGRLHDWFDL